MPTLMFHAKQAAGNISNQVQRTAGSVNKQLQTTTNSLLPPQQREQKMDEFRAFSHRNPKLAVLLAVQAVVLGLPILLFTAFAASTLLISLATCFLIAITSALIYTAFAVGFALLFLIPTLFTVSFAATCFFLWGLFIYLVLQRFNIAQAPVKRITNYGNDWILNGASESPGNRKKTNGLPKTNGTTDDYSVVNTQHTDGHGHVDANSNEWETKWRHGAQQVHSEYAKQLDTKVAVVGVDLTDGVS